jgi:hypothetical protein
MKQGAQQLLPPAATGWQGNNTNTKSKKNAHSIIFAACCSSGTAIYKDQQSS